MQRKKERLKLSSQSSSILFLSLSLSLSLRVSSVSLFCLPNSFDHLGNKQNNPTKHTTHTNNTHTHSLSLSLYLSHEFLPSSLPSSSRLSLYPQLSSFFSLFYYVLFSRLSLLRWFCLSVRDSNY
jgi:hypothetical protein